MRDHHIRLVQRAQAAGVLRADVDATDMLVLTMAIQATAGLGAAAPRPDIHWRVLGIVLDGLRPARIGPTRLPAPPLIDADLHPGSGTRPHVVGFVSEPSISSGRQKHARSAVIEACGRGAEHDG